MDKSNDLKDEKESCQYKTEEAKCSEDIYSPDDLNLQEKLNINIEPAKVKQVLDEVSIDGIVTYIKSGKCKDIITLAGAGLSTSAGIPDFRSPTSGIYNRLASSGITDLESIFCLDNFLEDPKPFFTLVKELIPESMTPTVGHFFLKLLHQKGLLRRHYTQNIDSLELLAGLPEESVVQAHGSFRTGKCLQCEREVEQKWLLDEIRRATIPRCECGGVIKPCVVLFGETLFVDLFEKCQLDQTHCDLLIIMGTTLTVYPVAAIVFGVPPHCPRLLLNLEDVWSRESMDGYPKTPNPKRDVTMIAECDAGCIEIATKLGWKDELDALVANASSAKL